MQRRFSRFLDRLSEFLSQRKGLLPLLGIALVAINAVLQFFPGSGWLAESDLLLHLGVIVALLGFLLGWAL
ncbi:MAG TPA: hypothetical protein VLS48_03405 [Anaerolineales bacterium]|nr:hypothetical protein [Anaerolineales bacterium]